MGNKKFYNFFCCSVFDEFRPMSRISWACDFYSPNVSFCVINDIIVVFACDAFVQREAQLQFGEFRVFNKSTHSNRTKLFIWKKKSVLSSFYTPLPIQSQLTIFFTFSYAKVTTWQHKMQFRILINILIQALERQCC